MTDNIKEEIEDKVIDCINSSVAGRLIVFKPEGKGFEDYLAVERKGKYNDNPIYLKINSLVVPLKDDNFVKDFSPEEIETDQNFYWVFVCFDEVKQKIKDYIWLVPSIQFADTAEILSSPDGEKLLRFQASLDIKNKNEYSRFIVSTKELGKMLLDALAKKGKLTFSAADFEEKEEVNAESLKSFLCEARRNTYAASVTPVDSPRLLGSVQMEFEKGIYFYRDIFFNGPKKFIGQEIVYQNSKPVWGMNYMGGAVQGATFGKMETNFLKEALFRLAEKCRMGGICEYEKREYKYQDRGQGDILDFLGEEKIFTGGKSIYKLNYQGGLITDKV